MKKSVIFLGSLIALTLVVIFGRDYVKGKVNSNAESPRVPKLIGNRLAHVFPIRAPGFKASIALKRIDRNGRIHN